MCDLIGFRIGEPDCSPVLIDGEHLKTSQCPPAIQPISNRLQATVLLVIGVTSKLLPVASGSTRLQWLCVSVERIQPGPDPVTHGLCKYLADVRHCFRCERRQRETCPCNLHTKYLLFRALHLGPINFSGLLFCGFQLFLVELREFLFQNVHALTQPCGHVAPINVECL